MSKPKILFACEIADPEAKARIEQYVEVIEISEATEPAVLARLEGVEGLIVPYTKEKVITAQVIDRGSALKIVGTTSGGTRQNVEDESAVPGGLTVIHPGASPPRPMPLQIRTRHRECPCIAYQYIVPYAVRHG